MSKFFLTTPIYYVNDKPHIGHAYTTIVVDALARFHRLRKEDVFFLTGTDENSQKNVQAMEKAGESDLTAYLDRMSGVWKQTWKDLDITIDDFIRTTEPRHLAGVNRFWKAVYASGDIELRDYESLYCTGCEAFKTETEIVNGVCPLHPNAPLKLLKERNYFFTLTKYRDDLLALYERPDFVMPEARRNEIRNYVENHLTDISISREAKTLGVGIPVPGDESQRIYVWFDALVNYLTAVGYGTDDALFEKWWPADLHLMAKDIIKFHCALWPAMLISAAKSDPLLRDASGGPKLPNKIFAHGYFTIDGQKISKSLGNAVDPREAAGEYGMDALRYFLLREIPFGEDGDFSRDRLRDRYSADLGNTLGNLLNRVIAMSRKYFDGKVPETDPSLCVVAEGASQWSGAEGLAAIRDRVSEAYESTRCDLALAAVWDSLILANKYIEETQPFKLVKTDAPAVARVLYALLEACRWYAWMILPVMPHIAEEIFSQLGLDSALEMEKGWEKALVWGGLEAGTVLPEPKVLFPKREDLSAA